MINLGFSLIFVNTVADSIVIADALEDMEEINEDHPNFMHKE
jgi:hypothetical protein